MFSSCSEGTPRPESYREDYSLAKDLDTEQRRELFKELRLGVDSIERIKVYLDIEHRMELFKELRIEDYSLVGYKGLH